MSCRQPHLSISLLVPWVIMASSPVSADTLTALEKQQCALFDRVAPSVVFISTGSTMGSGFFIDRGLILTNAHVVGNSKRPSVVLHNGKKLVGQVVERASDNYDLALVQVSAPDIPPLIPSTLRQLRVGSWVGAVGHGEGALWAFNTGMVSNIYPDGSKRQVFQTQIPLNPGSSGAPIFDRHGHVVGIVTAGIERANSINFALRIDLAFQALRRLSQRSELLTIFAPRGIAVMVDGIMAGTGPKVTLSAQPKKYTISAVVRGKLRKLVIQYPQKKTVDLR